MPDLLQTPDYTRALVTGANPGLDSRWASAVSWRGGVRAHHGAGAVTLRGATPAVDHPFSILTPPEPIPDVGYAEGQRGSIYIEDRERMSWWSAGHAHRTRTNARRSLRGLWRGSRRPVSRAALARRSTPTSTAATPTLTARLAELAAAGRLTVTQRAPTGTRPTGRGLHRQSPTH
ncbi:hypothetical protein [Actinophytocola sp. KF-1]